MRPAVVSMCFLSAVAACGGAERQQVIEYRNGVWWDGRTEDRASRLVSGNRFVASVDGAPTEVVDLQGAVVTAPFADGHNHDLVAPIFEQANRQYLQNGIFYSKIAGAYFPAAEAVREAVARPETVDAVFTFGGITSPGGHPVPLYVEFLSQELYSGATYDNFATQAFHEASNQQEILSALDILESQDADFVKSMLIYSEDFDSGFREGLDPGLLPFLVREAHERNLPVSLHAESAEDFRQGVLAGVDEVAHLPGGLLWGPKRTPDQHLLSDSDAKSAASAGVAVVTTTLFQVVYSEIFGIEATRIAEFKEVQRKNLQTLTDAGVEIRVGSDVYDVRADSAQPAPARREVENLVALDQIDRTTALAYWMNTGREIFPERRIGCFEVGCEASFLVFEKGPRRDLANLGTLVLARKQGVDVLEDSTSSLGAN